MSAVAARWISVIGGSTLLITGTVGALFNIAVFTHRTLRKCSCSWYILVAAIFDLLTLDHPLLLRILADGFGLDLAAMDTTYCRFRFYTGQISSFVPITLVCLAAFDRWASTCRSSRIRRWSSTRAARYSIVLTILSWSVVSIPNLVVYRVTGGACRQTSATYSDYTAFFLNPILYGLLPISLLASFGYASYRNVQQVVHRQQRTRGKIEEQLTRSICLQCASFIISQVPYTLWNLYSTFTRQQQKNSFRLDLELLFTQLTRLLFYLNYVSSFYINLIASNHIRNLARSFILRLLGRRVPIDNRLHPITNTLSRSIAHSGWKQMVPVNIVH